MLHVSISSHLISFPNFDDHIVACSYTQHLLYLSEPHSLAPALKDEEVCIPPTLLHILCQNYYIYIITALSWLITFTVYTVNLGSQSPLLSAPQFKWKLCLPFALYGDLFVVK